MHLLIRTAVLTVVIACGAAVFGVASRAQNKPSPQGPLAGVNSQVVNVRPPACTAPGKNNLASSNSVPDPDCTMVNHPLTRDEKGGTGDTGQYEVVPNHFKPNFPKGITWGRVGGIWADSPDRVYVYISGVVPEADNKTGSGLYRYFELPTGNLTPTSTRREHILSIFDRSGKHIGGFKEADPHHQSATPHRVRVSPYDPEKHVWLVDEGRDDQVLKFTRDGKLVMKVQGKSSTADIAFLPNGDFYALQRGKDDQPIIHYSKDGKEIRRLGAKGSTFDAHCIAFDKRGRIYVGEINNDRVQVFDASGKTVDIWPNIRHINFCAMDKNEHLWVFDSDTSAFLQYDTNGRLLSRFGVLGTYPGRFMSVNQFHVDTEGNLYTAEPMGWRPQMLRPKKDAKPSELIPQLLQ